MKHPFLVTRTCINSARTREEMAVYRNTSLSILPPSLTFFYFFIARREGWIGKVSFLVYIVLATTKMARVN